MGEKSNTWKLRSRQIYLLSFRFQIELQKYRDENPPSPRISKLRTR